jgi:hypothetical protein
VHTSTVSPNTSSHSTRPVVASVSRLIMRSSVDLPAPERPMMPTIWPVGTSNETSSTATSEPNLRVNRSTLSIPSPSPHLAEVHEDCQD